MLQPGEFECTNCGNITEWNPEDIRNRNFPFEKCPNCSIELDDDSWEDEEGYLYYDFWVKPIQKENNKD